MWKYEKKGGGMSVWTEKHFQSARAQTTNEFSQCRVMHSLTEKTNCQCNDPACLQKCISVNMNIREKKPGGRVLPS